MMIDDDVLCFAWVLLSYAIISDASVSLGSHGCCRLDNFG